MALSKFELTIDGDSFTITSIETGETKEVKLNTTKKSSTKKSSKPKDDGDPNPKITLDENKYTLNSAAADILLNDGDDNRLEIKYMKNGKETVPVIMNSSNGNKVTKSLTVACRGKARQELAEYGTVFGLRPYPGKSNVYILVSGEAPAVLKGDENVSLPEEEPDPVPVVTEDDDLDLTDILGDEDSSTEVSAMNFEL